LRAFDVLALPCSAQQLLALADEPPELPDVLQELGRALVLPCPRPSRCRGLGRVVVAEDVTRLDLTARAGDRPA
jgi:hypothetical protein